MRHLWMLFFVVAGALSAGCQQRLTAEATEEGAAPEPEIERIVLVTVDTLRADHTTPYGYIRDTTPFLDRLAKGGVVFENTFSSSSMTVPSHATIFTGLQPLQTAVQQNGHVINESFLTLAEMLRERGYSTAAFIAVDRLFEKANLHQGFDTWNQTADSTKNYRRADETVSAAIDWLENVEPTEKFFVWVHLFDPHTPYRRDEGIFKEFDGIPQKDKKAFLNFHRDKHYIRMQSSYNNDYELLFNRMNLYDTEVRFADRELGRLYDHLQSAGLYEDAMFVVTADHGEGLGGHGYHAHSRKIWSEQIRVPLIFEFSSGKYAGTRIGETVSLVDLFPTFAEIAAAPEAVEEQIAKVQGLSLVPLFPGKAAHQFPFRYTFSQRRTYDGVAEPEEVGHEYTVQNNAYRLFYRTELGEDLYDMRTDKYEEHNLAQTRKDVIAQMTAIMEAKIAELSADRPYPPVLVDAEGREQLEALGYLQ